MSNAALQIPASQDISSKSQTFTAKAYAAQSPTSGMAPHTIKRRDPRPQDVQIEILYCGVCHSDLHQARDEWQSVMPTVYPCVPGHEIVGRVVKVGSAVKKFKEGDIAAVGCMVDSCRNLRQLQGRRGAVLRQRHDLHLQRRRQDSRRRHLRRLFRQHRGRRSLRAARPARSSIPPAPRRCSARASPPIRRCATGKWARDRRSASSAWAAWATWA